MITTELTPEAAAFALAAALAVFLTWAIGREIDPANDWSAFVGLPFIFLAMFAIGSPLFLALFFILLLSRILSGSTGLKARTTDSLGLVIMGAALFYNGLVSALPVLALVFFIDAFWEPANLRQKIFIPVPLAVFTVIFFLFPGEQPAGQGGNFYPAVAGFLLTAAVLVLLISTRRGQVVGDTGGAVLNSSRVAAAQVVTALFILGELFSRGNQTIFSIYPAFLAYAGTALYHLAGRLRALLQK